MLLTPSATSADPESCDSAVLEPGIPDSDVEGGRSKTLTEQATHN